jgi:hypothetical protein
MGAVVIFGGLGAGALFVGAGILSGVGYLHVSFLSEIALRRLRCGQ